MNKDDCESCTDGKISPTHDSEHPGICCDCYDLNAGMPVSILNRERKEKGKPPIKFRRDQ